MEKVIEEKELGLIYLRESARARHYSIKISKGKIIAVMPVGGDLSRLLLFVRENREKLKRGLQKSTSRGLLNEETSLQTATFRLSIQTTERKNYYLQLKENVLYISCPKETDFNNQKVQDALKNMLERALRHEAQRCLPERLMSHARKHNFVVKGVKINNAKTRWGSCNSKKIINLSLSLMLLPWHLIDYVLLHELCHTREMNHGERFWMLMDSVTETKAKQLREELKKYQVI